MFLSKIHWFLLFLLPFSVVQDDGWTFEKEEEGIKVYTRISDDSPFKELKMELSFENTTVAEVVEVITTFSRQKEWVYSCAESATKEKKGEVFYNYFLYDFPWPLSDRDAYLTAEVKWDGENATMYAKGIKDYAAEKKGVVRLDEVYNEWAFTQATPDRVDLKYYSKSNPGGSLPAWLINLAIDKGPSESMKGLRNAITK